MTGLSSPGYGFAIKDEIILAENDHDPQYRLKNLMATRRDLEYYIPQ